MGKNRHFQAFFCIKYPLKPPKKRYFFGHEIYFMTKIREKSCAELCRNRRTPHNSCTPAAQSSRWASPSAATATCTTAPTVFFHVLRGFGGKAGRELIYNLMKTILSSTTYNNTYQQNKRERSSRTALFPYHISLVLNVIVIYLDLSISAAHQPAMAPIRRIVRDIARA